MITYAKAALVAIGMMAALSLFIPNNAVAEDRNIPKEVVDYYEDSVWAVTGPNGGGSAFNISSTFLITNKHVADLLPNGKGTLWKNTSLINYEVEVVAVSDVYDLAVLYCALCIDLDPQLLVIEARWFELGTAAYGGGYGYGLLSIHAGYIQSFNYWRYMPSTDTITQPGDSGSPLIVVDDDGTFRLVGVRTLRKDHVVLLEPAGGVAGFLQRNGLL